MQDSINFANTLLDEGPTERDAVCLRRVCKRLQLDLDKGSVEHVYFQLHQRIRKTSARIKLDKMTTVQQVIAATVGHMHGEAP